MVGESTTCVADAHGGTTYYADGLPQQQLADRLDRS